MEYVPDLTSLVTQTITHAQNRFQDPETGKSPHFMLSFSMNKTGITKAVYTPILNHAGNDFYLHLLDGQGSTALPWTYEDTFRHLESISEPESVDSKLILDNSGEWNAIVGGVRAGQIIFTREETCVPYTPIIFGGSRKGQTLLSSKMKRPWQPRDLEHDLSECPLCNRPQSNEKTSGDLKSFDNSFTPWSYHQLIIPTKTFYESGGDDKQYFSNPESLDEVLGLASCLFSKSGKETADLFTHQGSLAGQNLAHLHYHFLSRDI